MTSEVILPQQITMLSKVCPGVVEDKVLRAFRDSQASLRQIAIFSTNLKRKDYTGKLKEILNAKTFTHPFVLKKIKNPCVLILQPVGQKEIEYTCVFPPNLEASLQIKDFFNEGEVFLFSQLSICVSKTPETSVFFFISPATKSRFP